MVTVIGILYLKEMFIKVWLVRSKWSTKKDYTTM